MAILRRARGVRIPAPGGTVIGRLRGSGAAGPIVIADLARQVMSTGVIPSVPAPSVVAAGTGIGVSYTAPTYTVSNTGVLSNIAGSGISVSGATGNVTIGNTGVLSVTAPAAGFTVNAATGAVTFTLANDLAALEALSSAGMAARTGTSTWAVRTITGPAAGITVSNGDGVSGNPTLALANDLSALEALSSTGLAARTATDTWAQRTITGTASRVSVSNGDGVSGNPTLDIDAAYVGQSSITTLGTIGTGTWAGTTIAVNHGGTGQTSYTDGQLLIGNSSGNTLTKATLTAGSNITITNAGGSITIAGSAGGSTTYAGLTDVNLSSLANKDLLWYQTSDSKWHNATLSAVLDSVLSSTQGSVAYRNASAWVTLAPSTSGYVLTTGGTGANPVWAQNSVTVTNNPYFTLSNSNLTATQNTSINTNRSIFASTFRSAGLAYFEFVVGAFANNEELYGIATSAALTTTFMGGTTNSCGFGQQNNGTSGGLFFYNNVFTNDCWSSSNKTTPAIANGDVISIAIDFTNKKIWARQNAGAWNARSAGTQDPATNQGGLTATTLLGNLVTPGFTSADNVVSGAVTLRTSASSFTQTMPSGYTAWDDGTQSPAIPTTWGTSASAVGNLAVENSPLSAAKGGTGVENNAASTITISGSFGTTFTVTATTNSTLPSGTHTLAGLDVAQTWSANQQFNSGNFLLKGSTSGTLTVKPAAAAGSNTLTLPAGTTDFSATGGSNQIVKQTSAGGALTVATQAMAEHSDYSTWAADTPTVTAGTGTFTTVSGTQRWLKIGKMIHVIGSVTITTNGTAATSIIVTLPVTGFTAVGSVFSPAVNAAGASCAGNLTSATQITFFRYDGTYPGATGGSLIFSYFYEVS